MNLKKIGTIVRLVPYIPEHAPSFYKWFYDVRYQAFFRDYDDLPYTLDDFKVVGQKITMSGNALLTILDKTTGIPMGLMTYTCLKRKAGIFRFGIMLDQAHQRNTFAIESIILCAFHLFRNEGCHKLAIEFLESDKHIQRIAEKGGFVFESTLTGEALVDGKHVNEARYFISREMAEELYGSYYDALPEG